MKEIALPPCVATEMRWKRWIVSTGSSVNDGDASADIFNGINSLLVYYYYLLLLLLLLVYYYFIIIIFLKSSVV